MKMMKLTQSDPPANLVISLVKKIVGDGRLHIEIKIGDMKKIIPISPKNSSIKLMVNDFLTRANQHYSNFFVAKPIDLGLNRASVRTLSNSTC
jgi:hypothetical protein